MDVAVKQLQSAENKQIDLQGSMEKISEMFNSSYPFEMRTRLTQNTLQPAKSWKELEMERKQQTSKGKGRGKGK